MPDPYTMPKMTSREALLEQRRQIDARLKQLEAREREQARKQDARRKIIAGALALEHAERSQEFGAELHRVLSRFVDRPQDRALFGLPPKEQGGERDNRPAEGEAPTLRQEFSG